MKEGGAAGLLNEGGGAAGRGEQQASCLVAKQAVEFPQVYTSRVILRRCTNTYPPTTHTGQSFSSWIYMQGTGSSYRLHHPHLLIAVPATVWTVPLTERSKYP